ncbi:MAG TPA: AAA family ATPase, partial [Microthrixaceae bacterium]|nr:AAA family ATPase [Microthrixaceae bacterium]
MIGGLTVPDEVSFLEPFVSNGVFGATEVQVVSTFARASGEKSVPVLLAAALAVRAPLLGHVCVELSTVAATVVTAIDAPDDRNEGESRSSQPPGDFIDSGTDTDAVDRQITELPWPDPATWVAAVAESNLVARVDAARESPAQSVPAQSVLTDAARLKPLVLDGGRLYLSRYWYHERYVAADLVHRTNSSAGSTTDAPGSTDSDPMAAAEGHVRRLFNSGPGSGDTGDNRGTTDSDQLLAALAGLQRDLVVISGGPGTGKTTTVARFLAGLLSGMHQVRSDLLIALAAPTGKAATRMTESIRSAIALLGDELDPEVVTSLQAVEATTIHRLLGSTGGGRFRHGPDSRLHHDVVIVDEVSMVSLSLMAHLLSAIRPDAKVVLVGDPYQLASVEAGVVLGDIVGLSASTPAADTSSGTGAGIPVP